MSRKKKCPSGFSKLLCTRFYAHIAQSQLEYDLAINHFMTSQLHTLEEAQNNCIKKIYGARGKASSKFLFRSLYLPEDALLACLLPYIRNTRGSQWYALSLMHHFGKRRCIRWRLGWLPGGKPQTCPKHPTQQLSKDHTISCLDMRQCLLMSETIRYQLSSLLHMLSLRPSVPPNLLHHNKLISAKHPHGQKLIV
ncbi:hypothetical protein BCV72DRAFT_319502 [Rhizopus microsporus var. microsporus]|uniref:Uncharacterized protein n=1 Tax=Rhizopus microsporus var. microsporus TaxID=86635 RepID=A0A1X0RBP9_RHIZD|nr:hypothetical protein BCV72DRAFT_319502 [Rhizopus microsporus var. microsporus]